MEEEKYIGQGKVEVLFVCDDSLKSIDAPFYKWLSSEGFTFAGHHGNYGSPCVYVNITKKQYAYPMPGVSLAQIFGNHGITMEEFFTIYNIYKKYEGKPFNVFHSEPYDY